MHSLKRLSSLIAFLGLLAVGLSGCIHGDLSITFKDDGSGTYTQTEGITKQLASFSGSSTDQLKQQLDDAGKKMVAAKGGTYQVTDDGSYLNLSWSHPFKNVDELNGFLKDAFTSSTATDGSTPSPIDTGKDRVTVTKDGSNFHVTGQLDFTLPTDSNGTGGGAAAANLLQDARLQVAITMPQIIAHKGGVVKDNTVTYTVHPNEKTAIDVTGGPSSLASAVSNNLGLIIGGLIVVAAIAGGLIYYFQRQRRAAQIAPAAPGAGMNVMGDRMPPMPSQPNPLPPSAPYPPPMPGNADYLPPNPTNYPPTNS